MTNYDEDREITFEKTFEEAEHRRTDASILFETAEEVGQRSLGTLKRYYVQIRAIPCEDTRTIEIYNWEGEDSYVFLAQCVSGLNAQAAIDMMKIEFASTILKRENDPDVKVDVKIWNFVGMKLWRYDNKEALDIIW